MDRRNYKKGFTPLERKRNSRGKSSFLTGFIPLQRKLNSRGKSSFVTGFIPLQRKLNSRGKSSFVTGFTLIEILISTLVFVLALGALLSSIAAILHLIEESEDRTIAISDLRDMMEEIRVVPFVNTLLLFPDSVVDGPGGNSYQSIVGGYELNNQHIIVTYADVNADPLEIRVDLSWQDMRGRAYGASLSTFKSR